MNVANLENLQWPDRKQENWRYTALDELKKLNFKPASQVVLSSAQRAMLEAELNPHLPALVFVNGYFAKELSRWPEIQGVTFNLSPQFQTQGFEDHLFTSLAGAYSRESLHINVGAEVAVPNAIQLVSVAVPQVFADGLELICPTFSIHLEPYARAQFIERHISLSPGAYLSSSLTRVFGAKSSQCHYGYWQQQNSESFHFAHSLVDLSAQAQFGAFVLTTGSQLSRHQSTVDIRGEGGSAQLDGLYMVSGRQQTDHYTAIQHHKPHGTSQQLYKGILADQSRAVFSGKIHIDPQAQKTNSSQLNNSLLLGPDAEVDTKPQLEIYADDVKATHGATVGQMEEEPLFYLMSRGVSRPLATQMLARGFIDEVLFRQPMGAWREELSRCLDRYFANKEGQLLFKSLTEERRNGLEH